MFASMKSIWPESHIIHAHKTQDAYFVKGILLIAVEHSKSGKGERRPESCIV